MRVVIADDAVLLREGIARLLEDAGLEVAAQSGTADDLLRHVPLYKPQVAIIDIRMPPTHTDEGLRAAQVIRERYPEVGVLVLSQYAEPAYALELLSGSAEGRRLPAQGPRLGRRRVRRRGASGRRRRVGARSDRGADARRPPPPG